MTELNVALMCADCAVPLETLQAENADLRQQLSQYEGAYELVCGLNADLRQQLAKYQRELEAAQAQLVQAQAAIAELINRMGTYAFVG